MFAELVIDPLFWGVALIGVLITGISKSGMAGGAGGIAVPLLALVMPVPAAAAVMLPILILMDAKSVQYYFRFIRWREIRHIIPGAVFGIGIAGLLLGRMPDAVLQGLLGVLCIGFAWWAGYRVGEHTNPQGAPQAWFWGGLSGFSSTLIHSGGPPINMYLMQRRMSKQLWLATATIFFAVINLIKIIPYWLNGQWQPDILKISLLLAPLALLGVALGYRLQRAINDHQFARLCNALLYFSGGLLLVKAFF